MEEFLEEAFRIERDLVRLRYWITSLDWRHYRIGTRNEAELLENGLGLAITRLHSLRSQIREQRE